MRRLSINPGTPEAWETLLKPGTYRFGREEGNDFQVSHPSVSGHHCEVVVDDEGVLIRDLGSSNGTFVEGMRVDEERLRPGQSVQLGSVELMFDEATGEAAIPVPPPLDLRMPPRLGAAPEVVVTQAVFCKFHATSPARFHCAKCKKFYCSLCVSTRRTASETGSYCRVCGAIASPVVARGVKAPVARGFFAQLPGVFVYPLRGWGGLMIVIGAVVFAFLGHVGGILRLAVGGVAAGYLFSYMQNIIHSTAAGDKELPDLPEWDGLIGQAFSLTGTVLISFGPALLLGYIAFSQEQPWAGVAMVPAVIFGCIYFPMAFLVVAMKDTVLAANPLVVVPSIFRVPVEYAVAIFLMGGVFGIRWLGDLIMGAAGHTALHTRSVAELLGIFALQMVWSLVSLYLLSVSMRILGILYVTKKDELGWF